MNKRIAMLAAVLLALAVPAFSQTEADFEVGLTEDGEGVVIKKYVGKTLAVRIPAAIQGMPVREIGARAFSEAVRNEVERDDWQGKVTKVVKQGITSVVIPEGVARIGARAFSVVDEDHSNRYQGSLTTVTIPDTVSDIGQMAFFGCTALTEIRLPAGLTKTGGGIFFNCTALKTVTIPKGVKVIGEFMFSGCSSLTTLTIPDTVISVGVSAFAGGGADEDENDWPSSEVYYESDYNSYHGAASTGLVSVTWPVSVPVISKETFMGCKNLKTITIPEGVTVIQERAFYYCTALTEVRLPSTIRGIGPEAFANCGSLLMVNIPDSVQTIRFFEPDHFDGRAGAFHGCSKLLLVTQAALKKRGYTGERLQRHGK